MGFIRPWLGVARTSPQGRVVQNGLAEACHQREPDNQGGGESGSRVSSRREQRGPPCFGLGFRNLGALGRVGRRTAVEEEDKKEGTCRCAEIAFVGTMVNQGRRAGVEGGSGKRGQSGRR